MKSAALTSAHAFSAGALPSSSACPALYATRNTAASASADRAADASPMGRAGAGQSGRLSGHSVPAGSLPLLTPRLFPAGARPLDEGLEPLLDDWLDGRESKERANVDALAAWLRAGRERAASLREEAAESTRSARALEESCDMVSRRCASWLDEHGLPQLSGTDTALRLRRTAALSVDDESLVPGEWRMEKVTSTISKSGILAALKCGNAVPGCSIAERLTLQEK